MFRLQWIVQWMGFGCGEEEGSPGSCLGMAAVAGGTVRLYRVLKGLGIVRCLDLPAQEQGGLENSR